jgi:hypothetical protein
MNWGKGIFVTFIIFTGILVTMVVISMKQEVGLVAPDYYKQEIAYQKQIDRINNYNSLTEKPMVSVDRSSNDLVLKFSESGMKSVKSGEVHLFRPSHTGADQKHLLKLNDNGEQRINISQLLRGRWKVNLSWQGNTKEYYDELSINL